MAFPLASTALRLSLTLTVLLTLVALWGKLFAGELLPPFARLVEFVVPQVRVLNIDLGQSGADSVIRLDASPAAVVVVAGQLLPLAPRTRFHAVTLAGHVFQGAVLFLAALVAWPAPGVRAWLLRLGCGLPVLALLTFLDVPLVLANELEQTLLEIAGGTSQPPLAYWIALMENGGRLALAVVCAATLIAMTSNPHVRSQQACRED